MSGGASKVAVKQPARAAAKKPAKKSTTRKASRASRLSSAEIEEMFARLAELNPSPTTELEYTTPYELLVAVTLSAQATDVGVNKATRKLFPVANTPARIAALGVEGLKPYIATIGLFNTKARNVIALSRILVAQHGGLVPRERAALEALPGVGRKTANVVLNVAFGESTIAVDTHIFRVGNRTGLAPGKTPLDVERKLEKVVPEQYRRHAHHWRRLRRPARRHPLVHRRAHRPRRRPSTRRRRPRGRQRRRRPRARRPPRGRRWLAVGASV